MDPQELRDMDQRRFSAQSALKSMVECLRESAPTQIFSAGAAKDKGLFAEDNQQIQRVNNQWINKAGDVLETAMSLADAIGQDALSMFREDTQGKVSAKRSRTPENNG